MRRLHAIQKCHSTAVLLRHFFGCGQNTRGLKNAIFERLFLLFFLLNCGGLSLLGQNPADIVPVYDHIDQKDLGTAGQNSTGNLVISIDTDSQGFVYILTFGNGVFKYNPEDKSLTNIISDVPGENGRLNGPLDLVIDNNDIIYIADSGSKLIKKFNTSGNSVGNIGSGSGGDGKNEFWEPTGLAIDGDNNLYIVDSYRGSDSQVTERYFLKIYYSNGNFTSFQGTPGHPLDNPFRVAANENYILISHAENDGKVLVFSKNLDYVKTLSQIGSPGSIEIDNFGYIHIIDYSDELDFNLILNYETLGLLQYFLLYNNISSGIDQQKFAIQIYDSTLNHTGTLNDPGNPAEEDDHLQLPLDLAFNNCSKLFINDGNLDGLTINFDLEIYERSPSTDLTPPVANCVSPFTVVLQNGTASITAEQVDNNSSDNCAIVTKSLSQYNFTTVDVGTVPVTLTVTDSSGLTDTCTVNVTVENPEGPDPPEAICNSFSVSLDGDGMAQITAEQVYSGNEAGLTLEINTTSFDCFNLGDNVVVLIVTDPATGLSDSCPATITVKDEILPTMTCPTVQPVTVPFGETGKVINYTAPIPEDNCSVADFDQIAGLPPGSKFRLGDTENTFRVIDTSGNEFTCSFTVTINQAEDETPPVIDCPVQPIVKSSTLGDCFAVVEYEIPTATDNSGPQAVSRISGPESGDQLAPGDYEVLFEAKDDAGNFTRCTLDITVIDEEAPVFTTCPSGSERTITAVNGQFLVPDLTGEFQAEDNCTNDAAITYTQVPDVGEEIFSNTTLKIYASDEYNNQSVACEIQLIVDVNEDELEIFCPPNSTPSFGDNCAFELPDYTSSATVNSSTAQITQDPPAGTLIYGRTEITLTATEGGETAECSFMVDPVDEEAPVFTICPSGSERTITAVNGQFLVPDLAGEFQAEDNCTNDAAITYTQVPDVGEEIFSNTTLKIYASDEYNNQSVACEIQLIVDVNEDELEIFCPPNSTPSFGDNCAFELPDYTSSATVNSSTAQITQDPPEGTLIYGRTEITLTATEGGETAECSFMIDPVDDVKPIINCRDDLEIHLNEDGFGVIPPEILLSTIEDNCGIDNVSLSKSRFETSDVGENDILVTVEDVNGNVETCEATVNVVPYDPLKDIRCTESGELELDQDGYAELTLTYTGEDEDIQLELSKKDFTCDDIGLPQMITATYNGQYTGSCEVEVTVVDKLAPRVNCISKIDLVLDENGQGQLSVEDVDLNSTDNCKIEDMSLSKSNFTTEDVGTQTVRFTVTDASGNSDFCEVVVNVRPFMGTGGDLNCVEEVILQLNNDGNAILKAKDLFDGDPSGIDFYGETTYTCEDLGTNYITFSKIDDPSQTCEIRVEVEDNIGPVAHCKADYVLTLGANGTATLSPEDFGAGSTDNCGITSMSLNRTSFTTADLGQQQLVLTVTDNSGNVDICETPILVQPYEENPSGIECKALFVLALNEDGSAQLQPQDLFTGGMSGTYNVSQSIFTCEDLGENEVILSYSTVNGSGTCTVKVMVEDPQIVCDSSPAPERDSLIMYPNPGDGLISFELSPGLQINRIEIFDFRGRFLREQQYDNSQPIPEYQLDLSAYQAGVYPLVIYTNGREYLKRAIIK
ncbi:HYR domain-containing protein [Salinimicrobium sp. MT39]|uniref:HYR domain-containing protein n=1 Tax=Salinimicrobium profundisediminis TaxID=2994553 RepID=A0A9X3CY25_9FLAO|nr:HYR domain-containing protein [Salinimicrobium profundisediminis]MCX2837639.1 HYR domain-containing protein [Salinimicrobium profundisediminis]